MYRFGTKSGLSGAVGCDSTTLTPGALSSISRIPGTRCAHPLANFCHPGGRSHEAVAFFRVFLFGPLMYSGNPLAAERCVPTPRQGRRLPAGNAACRAINTPSSTRQWLEAATGDNNTHWARCVTPSCPPRARWRRQRAQWGFIAKPGGKKKKMQEQETKQRKEPQRAIHHINQSQMTCKRRASTPTTGQTMAAPEKKSARHNRRAELLHRYTPCAAGLTKTTNQQQRHQWKQCLVALGGLRWSRTALGILGAPCTEARWGKRRPLGEHSLGTPRAAGDVT